MGRADWTMLAISYAKNQGLSPVQLQKSLFVLGRELPGEVGPNFYNFIAYNYGPFDRAIYTDASQLCAQGNVAIMPSGSGYNQYYPTPLGIQLAELLKQQLPSRAVSYLQIAVEWAQSLSFSALVRAIYERYPEYRQNSVFQG